jgi:protein TonB
MNSFTAVEKYPEMVVSAKPDYPEIAKRAGITGKVYVKVLVDKEGRPKKAVVIKTDSDLFNQPAIDAAMKSAFTPALQNNHPIAVWIVLPYRFTLENN